MVLPGRKGGVFGRTGQGDVVRYYRRRRKWRFEPLTRRKNIGLDYRIQGDPSAVAGPRRRWWVIGRNRAGHLIVYRSTFRGWDATNLTRARDFASRYRLASDPVAAVGPGDVVHVYGLDGRGGLIHYYWTRKGDWSAENLTERQRSADSYRGAGRPVLLRGPGRTHSVFLRGPQGNIVRYAWAPGRSWAGELVTERARPLAGQADLPDPARYRIVGEPDVGLGPDASIHLLGRHESGGLIHFARPPDGPWTVEDLTAERPAIGRELGLGCDPVSVFGPGPVQHVFARNTRDLILYEWRPTPSWTAENLTMERMHLGTDFRMTSEPVLVSGTGAEPHIFGTDADGRLVHVYGVP